MILNFRKISDNKIGILYNVKKSNPDFSLTTIVYSLNKTKTIFGLEEKYNKKVFKWIIDDDFKSKILSLEKDLINNCQNISIELVKSKIIEKNNYPIMIETDVPKNIFCCNDIIKHTKGILTSFNQINKKNKYNIEFKLENVSVRCINKKNILYYNLEITKIEECVNLI